MSLPAELVSALGERYELRRVLGRGGMATVYLAYDKKHHREVAIKVLLPALAAFLGVERFLKEIEIAARLTHPHILPLYDSGEAGGFLYYVMPFVAGGSLRDRMLARDRLNMAETMNTAMPVADALAYAHRMGVVHRDIKPENILFSEGHPIVADFGIARAVSTAGGNNLTRTGFPIGTPGYMSPEQAAGLSDLDQKTDVYSLAAVIFEMLMGELPGHWPTEESVRTGRYGEVTPRSRLRLNELGGQTEGALVRALAIRHDQRTATPMALIDELSGRVPLPRPRYSAEEVQQIVNRAAEIEASTPTQTGAMTIGGVKALADEVGIAPEALRQAVDSIRRPSVSRGQPTPAPINKWINGPTRIDLERVIDGELPESEYATLVEEIRYHLKNGGQVSQLGRSFSWSPSRGTSHLRDLEVVVTVRGGKTRIMVQENLSSLIGAVFGGFGGGMGGGGMGPVIGITVGALNLPFVLFAAIPLWFGMTYATARTVYRRTARKRLRETETLIARLEELTRELITQGSVGRLVP